MSVLDDPAALNRIFALDPEAPATLAPALADERVDSLLTERGHLVVAVDGKKIHSSRDPEREADRFARSLDLTEADVVVLLGFGSGFGARAVAEQTSAIIVAFEPNLAVLAHGLDHGPVPENVHIVTSAPQLGRVLYSVLTSRSKGVIATWTASTRSDPGAYTAAVRVTSESIDRAALRARTARLRARGWLNHYLKNLRHLPECAGVQHVENSFAGKPAIIVAAGPSLDQHIETLRALQDDVLILAVNTAATALSRAGVRPTAVVCVESLDISGQLADLSFLSDVPAFLELTANPATWQLPFKRKVAISVDTGSCSLFSKTLAEGLHLSAGFCVAHAATAIAHTMGCNPIVLVGSDLAYSGERVYAQGTVFEDVRAQVGADGTAQLSGLAAKRDIEERSGDVMCGNKTPDRAKTRVVDGWGGGESVHTTRDFTLFRDWYTWCAKHLREQGVLPINATEGGATIPGFTEIPLEDAVARHFPATPDAQPPSAILEAALGEPAIERSVLKAAIEAERTRLATVLSAARRALDLLDGDPDGDINASPQVATELSALTAKVQKTLHECHLAGDSLLAPLEELQDGGPVTSLSLFETIHLPVSQLHEELAHLVQYLADEDLPLQRTG